MGAAVEVAHGDKWVFENTAGGNPLSLIPSEHRLQQLNARPPLNSLCGVIFLQTHLVEERIKKRSQWSSHLPKSFKDNLKKKKSFQLLPSA